MPTKTKRNELPLWHLILTNDQTIKEQDIEKLTQALVKIALLNATEAKQKAEEATKNEETVIMTTHLEKAELYQDMFRYHSPPIKTKLIKANR